MQTNTNNGQESTFTSKEGLIASAVSNKESIRKLRIGDMLVQAKLITDAQLQQALAEQRSSGKKLGKVLVDLKLVDEVAMLKLLAKQIGVEYIDLRTFTTKPDIAAKLPENFARRYRALVLSDKGDSLQVAMADTMDLFAQDELSRILKKNIVPAVVCENDLISLLDKVYRKTNEIASLASELEGELKQTDFDLYSLTGSDQVSDAPVVRLLQSLFEDAVNMNASDIHIEPDEKLVRIRQRIDGILHEQIMKESRIAAALVSRLKIMSGLDISEKRLPQDGRFAIRVRNRNLDVRLSTMPVAYGESVVMRLLDQSGGSLSLSQLGMEQALIDRLIVNIERPHGLILVTGPTGSGKTTTLYAALNHLNSPENKIITVEDPVEYRLPRITQVQVNSKIDLSFARVLRSALRQDPDIVLIGEMRDQETAEIGLRAAMTGHMVFSTLHTNDAASSAMRLIDMGAAPYLVASSLRAVLAQRLIRKVCTQCSEPYPLEAQENEWLQQLQTSGMMKDISLSQTTFLRGRGCQQCNQTGYQGRFAVHEFLEMTPVLLDALRRADSAGFAQAALSTPGFEPLACAALRAACAGKTSVEEVLRITAALDTTSSTSVESKSS